MLTPAELIRHPLVTAIVGAVVGALLTILGTLLIGSSPASEPPVQQLPQLTIGYTYEVDLFPTLSVARLTVVNASADILKGIRIWINKPPPLNGPASIAVIGGSDQATTACDGDHKPYVSPSAIARAGFCAIVPELIPDGTVTVILPADPERRFEPDAPELGHVGVVANGTEVPRIKLPDLMRQYNATS